MLVKALGYHVIVSDTSLGSFTFLAGTIGVTDGVDSSKEFITVRDMLVMVDNCLDIGKMIPMYYNNNISPSYVIDEDDTFRSDFVTPTPDGAIKMEGIVTADASAYLDADRTTMKKNQLEISGKIFEFDGVAPVGYVGQHVYFYINVDSEGNYGNVVSIIPSNKNTVVQISGLDVVSASKTEIKYYITENKKSDIKTNLSTKWVYNGVVGGYCLDTVDFNGNVQLVAVDNNEDEIFDSVFVFEYEDAIVDSISDDSYVIMKNGYFYKGEKALDLREKENNIKVSYFDVKGKSVDFSEIKEGSLLSIARSNNGKIYRIVVSNIGGTALVEAKDGEYITLGTSEYKLLGINPKSLKIGSNYDYKINFLGRLVWAEEVIVTSDFAYVYKFSNTTGLSNPKVKLIIPEKVVAKTVETEKDISTNKTSTQENLCLRNNSVLVYNLAPKLTIEYWTKDSDGNDFLAKEKVGNSSDRVASLLNKPVSFEFDSKNEIVRLSEAKYGQGGVKFTYNGGAKTFYGSSNAQPFGIDENSTYSVVVPTNNATDDDILNFISELSENNDFLLDAYEIDDETHISKLLVYATDMISGVPGVVTPNKRYLGIVKKCSKVYNKETESESIKITMITMGNGKDLSEQTFEVSPIIPNKESFMNIDKGDFITYSLDGFDRLDGYSLKKRFGSYYDGDSGIITSEYIVCGIVSDIDYDEIDNSTGNWVDVIKVDYSDTSNEYQLSHSSKPMIFILDSSNRNAEPATAADIKYGDRVMVYSNNGTTYAVVIYR